MAEGVGELAIAVAPELVGEGHGGLGPGLDGAVEQGVGVFDGGSSSFRPTTLLLTDHGVPISRWSDGRTLVVVTHARELAARMDRVLRMSHGRLEEVRL